MPHCSLLKELPSISAPRKPLKYGRPAESALRRLRSLAGFRLESNRIGNYVAKTFDLMNEAQAASARAQQALFAANVTYKIKSGLYSRIASALQIESVAGRTGR